MPRIKPVEQHDLDNDTANTLQAVEKKLGMVPNMFLTFAHTPAALKAYLGMSDALSHGKLTAKQREIIALAVAQYNQCQYCLSAHTALGQAAGLTEDDISQVRKGEASNPLDKLIAKLARELTENRGVIDDDTLDKYQRQGLNHNLLVEIVANVSMNLLTNYLNHLADTDIDFPVANLAA